MRPLLCSGLALLTAAFRSLGGQALPVRDSANVTIVEHPSSTVVAGAFRLEKTPRCSVTSTDSAPMTNVPAAFLARDGKLIAAETNSHELRAHTCTTDTRRLWSTTDRSRSGPSAAINNGWAWRGDSLLVAQTGRVWVVDAPGRLVRSIPIKGSPICGFADGSMLVSRTAMPPVRMAGSGAGLPRDSAGPARAKADYIRYSLEDSGTVLRTIGAFFSSEVSAAGTLSGPRESGKVITRTVQLSPTPFGRLTSVRCDRDQVIVGDGTTLEYRIYSMSGALRRVVRLARPTAAVTAEDIRVYKSEQLTGLDDASASTRRTELESVSYPKTMPAFHRIVIDDRRRVWLEDFPRASDTDGRWMVFDTEGRLLGAVTVPKDARVMSIGANEIVLRRRNPAGVVRLEIYGFAPAT